jgi:exopolyphosphatase/guanosine-5'-triphosphate,3'-diphosphate pyrophosphatase
MSQPLVPVAKATAQRTQERAELDVREVAVIDVGSNSVRLVVFRVDGRAMTPILNEKVMAGLGRGIGESGFLNATGRQTALAALRRFAALVNHMGIKTTHAVATAALREARDGQAFAAQVNKETGIGLRIIDGVEEGRLSALGVLAGTPDAHGVVGDLGGSSLELATISPRGNGTALSYPLGPLALANGEAFDTDRVSAEIDHALRNTAVFQKSRGSTFYAVGGAWRALGRIDVTLRDHPLSLLHQHQMTRADTLKVVEFVRKQSRRSLERFEEAAAKRAEALPYAALTLQRILELGGFERVILSSYGLREGLLFDAMAPQVRAQDALIAAAEAFGAPSLRARAFGDALARFINPVFSAVPTAFSPAIDARLRAAACRLADIAAGLHPEQRGAIVFDLVVRAPLAAITHAERAFLAAAVHTRYTKSAPNAEALINRLLTEPQIAQANILGLAMRLGAELSGRSAGLMSRFQLRRTSDILKVVVRAEDAHLLTATSLRRLEPLANALGLRAEPAKD